ncbi:MAG: hypothetical protein ACLFPL_05600 [Candidatus Nanoarchaeia archaeon]
MKTSEIINQVKSAIVYENIEYIKLGETIPISIFEEELLNSKTNKEQMNKFIYDYLESDSKIEMKFGKDVDTYENVVVFSKIPAKKFNIKTPVEEFSPDWMIVFDKNKIKYAYFVVETKGSVKSGNLRGNESVKIECAKKHFKAISTEEVKFELVSDFTELVNNFKL